MMPFEPKGVIGIGAALLLREMQDAYEAGKDARERENNFHDSLNELAGYKRKLKALRNLAIHLKIARDNWINKRWSPQDESDKLLFGAITNILSEVES